MISAKETDNFGDDQDGKKWGQADSIDFPTLWRKIPRRSCNSFPLQDHRHRVTHKTRRTSEIAKYAAAAAVFPGGKT